MRVSIDIEGLAALVRDDPTVAKPSGTAQVIFVDAAQAGTGVEVMEHRPRLLVDLADIKADAKNEEPSDIIGLPDGRQMGLWDLTRKRVTLFTGPPKGPVSFIQNRPHSTQNGIDVWNEDTPRYPDTWNDISWNPEMSRAVGGPGSIDPNCLGDPPSKIVATRIDLTEGLIESIVDGEYEDRLWEFLPAPTPAYQQVCAARIRVRFDAAAGLTITLGDLDHNEPDETIEIPTTPVAEVKLAMVNLPGMRMAPDIDPNTGREFIGHFRAYHDLTTAGQATPWGARATPFLVGKPSSGPGSIKPVYCMGVGLGKP